MGSNARLEHAAHGPTNEHERVGVDLGVGFVEGREQKLGRFRRPHLFFEDVADRTHVMGVRHE
jgi:hypothetical protein